jgi:hypothetical protein
MGLYKSKNAKAKKALFEYLKAKDFHKLEEQIEKKQVNPYQSGGEIYASIAAISALGLSGDKSYIPLLESLQGVHLLQLEGGYPVESALAYLGSVDSLTNIPPDAGEEKIDRASGTVMKIRDPNKVPQLMATARNPKIADSIRDSALIAIGDIGKSNPLGVADFLIKFFSDSSYSRGLRIEAAISAGKTKDPSVEKPLLAYAQDPNSDIRQYAFQGLNFYMPEKYLDRCFDIIMDKNEDLEFRKNIEGIMTISVLREKDRRARIYECLNAVDKDGRPIDKIRIGMWRNINELYGEEPPVTLTTRHTNVTGTIRYKIQLRIMGSHLLYEEEKKKIEEELERIVSVYDENAN